ncbi:MAG: hypothetical protein R3Y52_02310, partial [Psittacicella sp.]
IAVEKISGDILNVPKGQFVHITSATVNNQLKKVYELYQEGLKSLKSQGFNTKISVIVLTGGGANMTGIAEAVQEIFGVQVRIGKPLNVIGNVSDINYPDYASVIGALNMGFSAPTEIAIKNNKEVLKTVSSSERNGVAAGNKKGGLLGRLSSMIKGVMDD